MRTTLALLLSPLLLVAGCATAPTIVPAGGAPQAVASAGPAVLTVFPSHWDGEPWDLTDYVTPIAVEIVNTGAEPVRVSYFDFALTDARGFRYAALNPFVTAQSEAGRVEDPAKMTLVAGRGVFIPAPRPAGPRFGPRPHFVPAPVPHLWAPRAHVTVRPHVVARPRGVYVGPPTWRGYSPLPYYRPWFGMGFRYWGAPWLYPPGYATWVWAWSPAFYPGYRTPPNDVLNSGLPEGVLEPGGRASGFIYFQRAHEGTQALSLSWNVNGANTNQSFGEARVELEVYR